MMPPSSEPNAAIGKSRKVRGHRRRRVMGLAGRCTVLAVGVLLPGCQVGIAAPPYVRPGIEVLLTDSMHLVQDRRVGLITNQTGIDRAGRGDVARLLDAGVNLTALFAPEHGFRGNLEQAVIQHGRDSAAGMPVFSLYGEVRAPTPKMLELIDVLLIDLQDIGARPYTYISTVLLAMEAAAPAGVLVVVLDRPNPIGGVMVQGPVLDTVYASYVGMLPVPLRHGMTMGELALLGNDVLQLGCEVSVVPAAGWRRRDWFDATGLPWVRPSPSMPDLESATHYPGLVLFEGTNLSVGRGTPVAFRVLGAPWLEPSSVIERLGPEPGVAILDSTIDPRAPGDGKYDGVSMPALVFRVTDRSIYDPTLLAAHLLRAIRRVHPDSFRIPKADYFDRRVGSDGLRRWLERETDQAEPWVSWDRDITRFETIRRRYLIYR